MARLEDFAKGKYKECKECTDYAVRFYGCDICKIKKVKEGGSDRRGNNGKNK